jgi:CRP/FNR family cyclic AMP-dependent transcriptional regulator
MRMLDRFRGTGGRERLIEALRDQFLVHGDRAIAEELAAVAAVTEHASGCALITQGGSDNDLYLLLAGEVAIVVNGRELLRRSACQNVGEMALIDPGARRSASVICRGEVVVAKITEADFVRIADRAPRLWRRIAVELANRLRQRNTFVRQRNETPIVFIGSSRESLSVTDAIVAGLASAPFITRPWTKGVFGASNFPIEDLENQVGEADFGVLVLGPDDKVVSRGKGYDAPRDNVVFELGLFMGGLGRRRSFLIVPRGLDIKIPTDLLSLTPIVYDPTVTPLADALGPVCGELKQIVARAGAR